MPSKTKPEGPQICVALTCKDHQFAVSPGDMCADCPSHTDLDIKWVNNVIEPLVQEIKELKLKINNAMEMILTCPSCGERHIDEGIWEMKLHHTHACQYCGIVWRPSTGYTVGVRFLPGFKNEESA